MARIENKEFNNAQVGNIEKINGDYFIKVVNADSYGNFISSGKLVYEPFDEVAITYPTTSTELYTYKLDSTDVATVLVTYSDATKENLTNVKRVPNAT